jgi:predicted ATPase
VAQRRILTPDRRLRVFVSSTLRELALERTAVREAISSLRLAPVLFELGARPHAPRDLYAAYVEQCDVFVGIYWQSYGWIAPGGQISGLEDEFDLAQGKPMLLYIKEPAAEREERLTALIRRIEEETGPAYRTFSSADELGALVTDDLALLLTERFHTQADEPEERSRLPARTTSFVGRDRELAGLVQLLGRSDVRLVTLTGPGGIGKTRLAVEAARELAAGFRDGAAYVPLDRLVDAELVPAAIAAAVGLSSRGPDQTSALVRWLRERHMLLVLDNFEHLLAGAPFVTQLLEAAGELEVLATSREPLRLQGEHEYGVPPLANAPALFMERVDAVRPGVVWDEETVLAAGDICRRVDGLPLAVELVAAGARMLPPRALLEHLGSSLHVPSAGRRDAPARQQTVRATIDWSYELLDEPERDLFGRLGAFGGSFTTEAARSVAGAEGPAVLGSLAALVEKSLVVHSASESETRFRMLHVVAEYAAERLADRADADAIRSAHAAYYAELARTAHAGLRGGGQRGWNEVLDVEVENLRLAVAQLARTGRLDDAAEVVWSVWPYWLAGRYLEGRKIVGELLASPGELSDGSRARLRSVSGLLSALLSDLAAAHAELEEAVEWLEAHDDDEGRAIALAGLGIATAPIDVDRARGFLLESARLYAVREDAWSEAMVLGALGWLDVGRGDYTQEDHIERAYVLARSLGDEVATGHTATNLAELHLARARPDEARAVLAVALTAYEAVRMYDSLSYGLEATAGLASSEDRTDEAARLLGAADGLRDEVAVPIWGPRLTRFGALVGSARAKLGDESFDARWSEGRTLGFDAALEQARRTVRRAQLAERS